MAQLKRIEDSNSLSASHADEGSIYTQLDPTCYLVMHCATRKIIH